MSFLKDLFLGKYGLSNTYWRGLFLGGIVVLAGHVAATYVAVMNLNNYILYDIITYGYAAFVFVWTIFICLAVINSSTYNRERGLWGWIASILACIGILRVLLVTAQVFELMPFSWNDLEKSIVVENLALPQQIDEGLILNSLVTNAYDYSLVYNLTQDIETYNSNTFDANVAKEFMIESCAEFEYMLSTVVEKIIFRYKANDGTAAELEVIPQDCGF